MKLYFSSKHIPQLQTYSLTQRLTLLREAQKQLTGPEKLLLNLLKLLIFVPAFVLILQVSTNWWALIWAGLMFLLYPLIITPIQYGLCAKYLSDNKP